MLHFHASLTEEEKKLVTIFTVSNQPTDAELFLSPWAGLVLAQHFRNKGHNVLLVFDTIVDYEIVARKIFGVADQPFPPYNICNEIMENTGCFDSSMTSIFLYDTNVLNFNYEKFQKVQLCHL